MAVRATDTNMASAFQSERPSRKTASFAASLLQYQFIAIVVWGSVVNCGLLLTFSHMLGPGLQPEYTSLNGYFASLHSYRWLLAVAMATVAQVTSMLQRHKTLFVRRQVFSDLVMLIRCVTCYWPLHLIHAFGGVLLASSLFCFNWWHAPDGETALWITRMSITGAVAGIVYSVNFILNGRMQFRFPEFQLKRWDRFSKTVGASTYASLLLSLKLTSIVFVLATITSTIFPNMSVENTFTYITSVSLFASEEQSTGSEMECAETLELTKQGGWTAVELVARMAIVSWFVITSFRMWETLQLIVLSEQKPLASSTYLPVSVRNQIAITLSGLALRDSGSIEEAFLSLPIRIAVSQAHSKVLPRSRLLETAHVVAGHSKQVGPNSARQIQTWWDQTSAGILSDGMTTLWQQISQLSLRRQATVLQAVYTSDAQYPGCAFWSRVPLDSSAQIVRAKAFRDLARLAKGSKTQRMQCFSILTSSNSSDALFNSAFADGPVGRNIQTLSQGGNELQHLTGWVELVSIVCAVIDSLTVQLQVAVKMCAKEPTVPVDSEGRSAAEAYLLGPSPRELESLSAADREVLAWHAQDAARRYRLRPWVSAGWWSEVLFSQFYEHNPVSTQREVCGNPELAKPAPGSLVEKLIRQPRNKVEQPVRGKLLRGWEKTWEAEQQQERGLKWMARRVIQGFQRTPSHQTSALFADESITRDAIDAISHLVVGAKEDGVAGCLQCTLPCITQSLVQLHLAITEYETSPVFLGNSGTSSIVEGNFVVRTQVMGIKLVLERAIYRIVQDYHKHVSSLNFLPDELTGHLTKFIHGEV